MARDLEIGSGKFIGAAHPCFIIAEVGQNHQGDINIAKKLILTAKDIGADCVKFQKSCLAEKFNAAALARPYDNVNSWGPTYGEHKQHLEFSEQQFRELQAFAASEVGILFTASAMDMISVDLLDSMDVPFIKVGSGDANNYQLLTHAANTRRPLIVSTGMQSMRVVREMYATLQRARGAGYCLLHCVSAYPTPVEQINLRVLQTFSREFPEAHIGYSGHETGSAISVAAVAMGARVLERHLTLDKSWKGSDHICSLTPPEFSSLVSDVRRVESALGSNNKCCQPCEIPCRDKLGKTVVATRSMPAGRVLSDGDLKVKVAEPRGWPAEDMRLLIGRRLLRSIQEDDSVLETDVKPCWSREDG